jgi:hypothetical protein
MLVPDGGGSGIYDSVVMQTSAVRAIASAFDRGADDVDARRTEISRLLDEAGEACSAPALLAEVAAWEREASADIRWRIEAALADPGTFAYDGKLFACLRFGSRLEAVAAARADAAALLAAIGDDFMFGAYNAGELRDRFPDIVFGVLQARSRSGDPAYAAAFVEALGARGVTRVLDVVGGVAQQPGEVDGSRDAIAHLLAPFDEIVAIATRERTPGMAHVEADLLHVVSSEQLWRLHLLLAAGDERPETGFTTAIARLVLDGPEQLRAYLHYTRLDPWFLQLLDVDTYVLRAVGRDPEAAHALIADEGCRRAILHIDEHWEEPPGPLADAAGRVLTAALVEWPAGSAGRTDAAFDTARSVVAEVADHGVSDEVKRALADATAPWLDRLVETGPRDDVVGFVAELSHDHDALTRLLGHAAVIAHAELAEGIAQARSGSSPLDRTGDEQQRVAALYGLVAAGMVQAGIDREERAALIAGSLKFLGGLATAGVVATTGVTGFGAAVAGATLGKVVDAGASAAQRALAGDGRDLRDFVAGNVDEGLRQVLAIELYNDRHVRAALEAEADRDGTALPSVPAEWRDGDRITPPPPDADPTARQRFDDWFRDWYGLATDRAGTDGLRDRVEDAIAPMRSRIIDEMTFQKLLD